MEETGSRDNVSHIGRKIGKIRVVRGMSQTELGELLGVSKQAVSKIEQSASIEKGRLMRIASALGVSIEGLELYDDETLLHHSNCFSAKNVEDADRFPRIYSHYFINKTIALFEELLTSERERLESLIRIRGCDSFE